MAEDRVIKLKCPVEQVNRRRIQVAEIVIDQDNRIIKDRFEPNVGKLVRPEVLEEATEVYA
jgi:hypothetical protein